MIPTHTQIPCVVCKTSGFAILTQDGIIGRYRNLFEILILCRHLFLPHASQVVKYGLVSTIFFIFFTLLMLYIHILTYRRSFFNAFDRCSLSRQFKDFSIKTLDISLSGRFQLMGSHSRFAAQNLASQMALSKAQTAFITDVEQSKSKLCVLYGRPDGKEVESPIVGT